MFLCYHRENGLKSALAGARHACDQGDGLDSYTWTEYDPRRGGVQVITDGPNNVKITTEFLKVPGGEHGGSWAARIKGEPLKDCKLSLRLSSYGRPHLLPAAPSRTSMLFYLGIEGLGGLDMDTEEDENVRCPTFTSVMSA